MLPTVTRTAEEVLRLVPGGLREAALALGAPEWRVTMKVVLPTARSGIVTAIILGTARVAGEAAPILLTAFGSNSMNANPFEGNQESLPLMVFSLIRQPNDNQVARAWGAALVLMTLILLLFAAGPDHRRPRPGPAKAATVPASTSNLQRQKHELDGHHHPDHAPRPNRSCLQNGPRSRPRTSAGEASRSSESRRHW